MASDYCGSSDVKGARSNYLEVKVISCRRKFNPNESKKSEDSSSVGPRQYTVVALPSQQVSLSSKDKTQVSAVPVLVGKPAAVDEKTSLSVPLRTDNSTSHRVQPNYSLGNLSPRSPAGKVLLKNESSFVPIEEDSDNHLISPSSRWLSQPRSYRGAKRDNNTQRKVIRKVPSFVDTTDGETSGMGSSVDEPIESSTESASEAPSSFLQPRLSSRPFSTSPSALKKRRGGWPKGRKRKPELPGTKPPKAPLTGYVLFLNERRKFYKETQAHLLFGEVTKLLGAEWSSMTTEQKVVYMNRSEQDRRRYRNELQSYRQSHDYQLQLRKKRIKNVIQRGATTTEESSDFTDEIDDDDREELYCRTCDQWFSSLHNKREHLYGKHHLQAITCEYQREREAEEKRQAATSSQVPVSNPKETLSERLENESEFETPKENDESVDFYSKYECLTRRESTGIVSTTEDDHDDDDDDDDDDDEDDEDDDEEREYDGEEEVTEEEGGTEYWDEYPVDSERVTDAAENVINKVLGREKEIRFLRRRYKKARLFHKKLSASLLGLHTRHQKLQEEQVRLDTEEKDLRVEKESLEKISDFGKKLFKIGKLSDTGDEVPDIGDVDDTIPDINCKDRLVSELHTCPPDDEALDKTKYQPVLTVSEDFLLHPLEEEETDYDPWIKSMFDNHKPENLKNSPEAKEKSGTYKEFPVADGESEASFPERPLHYEEEHSYSKKSHPSNYLRKKYVKSVKLKPVMKKVVEEPADFCDNSAQFFTSVVNTEQEKDIPLNETINQMARNHLNEIYKPPAWDLAGSSLPELEKHSSQTNIKESSVIAFSRNNKSTLALKSNGSISSSSSTNSNSKKNSSSILFHNVNTSSTDEQNEMYNYGIENFIQEDVYFRQLNLHLDPDGLADLHPDLQNDLHWEDEILETSGSSHRHLNHMSTLDNILEDDDLIKLLENDT